MNGKTWEIASDEKDFHQYTIDHCSLGDWPKRHVGKLGLLLGNILAFCKIRKRTRHL
jgi:hypothetical protein